MKNQRIGFAFFPLLLFFLPVLVVGAPLSGEEIPVYPGAVRDQRAEEEIRKEYAEYGIYGSWSSDTIKVYTVNAIIDEVCRYYIEQLGAEPGLSDENPYSLSAGEVFAPRYELYFYDEGIFEDQYEFDTLISDGQWVASAFTQRPQWEKGSWLNGVLFEWNAGLDDGQVAQYLVYLEDMGFDSLAQKDFRSTQIRIEVMVATSEEIMEEEADWAMEQVVAVRTERFRKNPPTEEFLGIPLYPGAVFDPELSAGMSLDEEYHIYVYFSKDSPDQIGDFYRNKLGKDPLPTDDLGYMFALKGSLPVPEEGLAIQPNRFMEGPFQTIISIQKKIEE